MNCFQCGIPGFKQTESGMCPSCDQALKDQAVIQARKQIDEALRPFTLNSGTTEDLGPPSKNK